MSGSWAALPVLPLTCVLEHLSLKDALAATATCRAWRQTLMLYEARRDTLKLTVCDTQRSLFLIHLFRRSIQSLHIFIESKPDTRLVHQYLQEIVPKFLDSSYLQEIIFVGPTYTDRMRNTSDFKLDRALVESLIHAHKHTLVNFAVFGCALSDEGEYADEKERFGSRNGTIIKPAPMILSKYQMQVQGLSSLGHILLEYEMLDTETLQGLSTLPNLTDLSLQLRDRKKPYQVLDWGSVIDSTNRLQVSLNIIAVPLQKFNAIINYVLVTDLPLVALRVLFCKTVHEPLIKHITRLYHESLREVEWTDAPVEFVPAPVRSDDYDDPCINPFILICWRCCQLQRLIINGYWIWQYDLLGMVRLRADSLQWLQVSAINSREQRCCGLDCDVTPVRLSDRASPPDSSFVQEMNRMLTFTWRPLRRWSKLHPALLAHCTSDERAEYVLKQISPTLEET